MMNFIAYSDGKRSLIEIAEKIGTPVWELYGYIDSLTDAGLMELD
jgi:aminopeptidase-like protein